MNSKLITLLLIPLFVVSLSFGQENIEEDHVKSSSNELGMHAGITTGIGLSFRHWSDKLGVQLTALPVKANDFYFISGGLTGLYSIKNKKYYRFYLYLGNHVMTYNVNDVENEIVYNVGFGPGFEVGTKVRFNIMVGYAAYDVLSAPNYSLLPTIETGLYFKF